jgi:uncharacterized protein with FMN-binding domain
MKSRFRSLTHLLSAGLLAVAAIGSAEASGWLSSGLMARLAGQAGPAPIAAAASAGSTPAPADTAPGPLAQTSRFRDGSFTGPAYNTYYGPVQVQVHIQGGRVTSVDVPAYPADRRASQRINSRALPMLESEVISAQSARVNIISGATLTSEAYLRSLDAALRQAGSATSGTDI